MPEDARTVEQLLSTTEVADWLNVPVETVRRWRKLNTGPPGFRIGRHVRYSPDEVRSWIAAQRNDERRPHAVA